MVECVDCWINSHCFAVGKYSKACDVNIANSVVSHVFKRIADSKPLELVQEIRPRHLDKCGWHRLGKTITIHFCKIRIDWLKSEVEYILKCSCRYNMISVYTPA